MKNEIGEYNRQNLIHTVDSYERYFVLTRNIMNSLYFNEYVNILENADEMHYITSDKVRQNLQSIQANPYLNLDNIAIYFQKLNRFIDKNGIWTPDEMFSKEYIRNGSVPEDWLNQMEETDLFQVMPAYTFQQMNMNNISAFGKFFPLITNNHFRSNVTVLSFSHADKLFEQYHQSINDMFYILDPAQNVLYQSTNSIQLPDLETFSDRQEGEYIRKGDHFYFFKKGTATGFFYINIVPVESITSQINRLEVHSIGIIIISIGFGILFSIWYVRRINNPIRQMIAAIGDTQGTVPLDTRINEFNTINRKVQSVMQKDEEISKKNVLIKNYVYINILKRIGSRLSDNSEEVFKGGPHVFILFDIVFLRLPEDDELTLQKEEDVVRIRDFIQVFISEVFPESITFQLEQQQVLSLVLVPDTMAMLSDTLNRIKRELEVYRDHYFLTIAVSPVFQNATDMPKEYEELRKSIRYRPLTKDTMIIWEPLTRSAKTLPIFGEDEFSNSLLSGKDQAVAKVLDFLSQLQSDGGSLDDFQRFSLIVINKTTQAVAARIAGQQPLLDSLRPYETIAECNTLEQYTAFFDRFISQAVQVLKEKNENFDPISRFVMEYVDQHPDEDISLELFADKLNITSNYLSSYFKEKTNMNFSEYVNGVRLGKAKILLLENNKYTIQQIGQMVGFYNTNTFIRNFKKLSGLTPGEFRKQFSPF